MATLETRLTQLADQLGDDMNARIAAIGLLASLNTTDKTSLVNAINELLASGPVISTGTAAPVTTPAKAGDIFVDTTNDNVYSATGTASSADWDLLNGGGGGGGDLLAANNLSDVDNVATALANLGGLTEAEVDVRVQLIVDTAPAALDTLNELAAALGDDANFAATMTTALNNRIRFDSSQTLSAGEITQAAANMGLGEPDTDFLGTYETARDA